MPRWVRWLIVPLLVVPIGFVLFHGFGRDPRETASPLIGRQAPPFSLLTLDGQRLTSEELRGRPYLLNFWASLCIPACVEEHPVLLEAQERWGDELTIVGVLYQDEPADALDFLARHGDGGWPSLRDTDGSLAIEYGVTGPPETYLVDADGVVRDKHFGPMSMADIETLVASVVSRAAVDR